MIKSYLLLNAFFYLLFTIWCMLKPNGTASTLGFTFLNNSGKIEYLAIYTGLELGIAVFLAISAFTPGMRFTALVFCVCMYLGIILVRTISGLCYGQVSKITYLVGALEYVLGITGIILLIGELKNLN